MFSEYDSPDTGSEWQNCDICTQLEYISETVSSIEERLANLEANFGDFDQQNVWFREWNFQPELSFVPPSPPPTTGSGLGISALFGLMYTIANLIMLTHEDLSQQECCVAMPEHWQLKPEGHRPQLVVQFAEKREDDTLGSAKYVVTIPHYELPEGNKPPPVNFIRKGHYYGVLKLNDNSKVQVYCESEHEARRVLTSFMSWIDATQLNGTYIRTGEISNPDFKEIQVFPKYATYYSKGSAPDSEQTRIYWG